MDTGRAGLIGGTSFEVLAAKSFFLKHGLLPNTVIKEAVHEYPTPDFSNLNSGTFEQVLSRVRFTQSGNPANFGWDMGAEFTKVLMIAGGVKPARDGIGLFMTDTLPSASELPADGNYLFLAQAFESRTRLFKRDASAFTILAADISLAPVSTWFSNTNWGMAIYYDAATDRLMGFYRLGSEAWWPAFDITDSSFAQFRYVGFRIDSISADTQWISTPIGIYAE